jgi:hypothetical protein
VKDTTWFTPSIPSKLETNPTTFRKRFCIDEEHTNMHAFDVALWNLEHSTLHLGALRGTP